MSEVAENLSSVLANIHSVCERVGRSAGSVQLIAVSKTFSCELIREAVEAGHSVFGESRLQEAEMKIAVFPGDVHWHFIGRLQRNKVRRVMQNFEVIHSMDSLKMAAFTNEIARELGSFPKVFLQVNIGNEASKGGFKPETLHFEMESLLALDRLEIMGLMCIPPVAIVAESSRLGFIALRELRDVLEDRFNLKLPGLSMGMSGDYEIAIEEGATHVRVGSAIFGKRSYRVDGELG